MKKTLIALLAVLALAVGCGSKKPAVNASQNTLTDVAPPPPVNTALPSGMGTGAALLPATPVDTGSIDMQSAPAAGQKYVVKQGDTLWSLAKRTYGDGNQYKRIKQANPSIKGDTIKAGETIILP